MKVLVRAYLLLTLVFVISVISEAKIRLFALTNPTIEDAIFEFAITGPDELCLYFGSIIGEFSGGGRATDVFRWQIINPNGQTVADREGGFQNFSHTFSEVGEYSIRLTVRRGVDVVHTSEKKIQINPGADILLESSYLTCENGEVTMQALDPATTNLSNFSFEWKDSNGRIVSTSNSFSTDRPDRYTVDFFTRNQAGEIVCPFSLVTRVSRPRDYTINISTNIACQGGGTINLNSTNNVFGNWSYIKDGAGEKNFIGEGRSLSLVINRDLDGPGNYEFIFEPNNSNNEFCKLEDRVSLQVNVTPSIRVSFEQGSDSCEASNGVLIIEVLTNADRITLFRNNSRFELLENVKEGDVIRIENLEPAIYRASVALGNCSTSRSALLPLVNPPDELLFEIMEVQDESCNETGTIDGIVKVKLNQPNFSGSFRLLTTTGAIIKTGELQNVDDFEFSAPAGTYHIELRNQQNCGNPNPERVIINQKGEVTYTVPNRLAVCEYFDFTPNTSMDLVFTLTYPDNSEVTKPSGEPFRIDQAGEYKIVGRDTNTEDGFCPNEKSFFVDLTRQINYEPELVFEDCFGNKEYIANLFGADLSLYSIRWLNEADQEVGTGVRFATTLDGIFKLDVQPRNFEACPTPPKSFTIEESITAVDVTLIAKPLCPGEDSSIDIQTNFDVVTQILWLSIEEDGSITNLDQFEGQASIVISEEGVYEAVVFDRLGCEIGRNFIEVKFSEDRAFFEIPEELVICEVYEIIPETELDLIFTITFPDGTEESYFSDEAITLDQKGEHIITAISADPDVFLCTITKTLEVKKRNALNFEPLLFEQTCAGVFTYTAELFGVPVAEADIFWYNSNGERLAEGAFFLPEGDGIYELEVRPKGSLVCPEPNRKSFEVITPLTELEGELIVAPYCPDAPFTTIQLDADLTEVLKINWYFTSLNGIRVALTEFTDAQEIIAIDEGFYSVEIFGALNCLLGAEEVLVRRIVDEVLPAIEETYIICAQFGLFETIDPGNFIAYKWYFNDNLISENRILEPQEQGRYELTVTTQNGCNYTVNFDVIEDCQMEVKQTTGMRANNDTYKFEVYANFLIDEVEVWIYNKWGQLVHHCINPNNQADQPACTWSGDINGEKVPPGSYVVKIRYKNNFENIDRTDIKSLLVLE
ncbi:MAG: hypothetical protein ACXIUD_11155 [Mongoliitalea sp.]